MEGMAVRVPTGFAKELQKIKREKEFPSMASALQYWISQQLNEQTETRLVKIEEKLNEILNEVKIIEDRLVRTDERSLTTAVYFAVELEELHGKGMAKSYLDRLEKITEMDIQELLKEREERRLKVAEYRKKVKK